ncbi:uncharacterized protein N7506_005226 [Penicillium brevicompactum]|uniref:uncharacterized protein n=1 Tax=Penicillium brevicompactum TaxID=5074 RepID=UPI0025400273|nr:uncharacterized protein N7506_005226 [Penicillium brevicompactum]KAJ5337204.1 hypothetical protein N7506_005226 [Penicillium brevicompactum]
MDSNAHNKRLPQPEEEIEVIMPVKFSIFGKPIHHNLTDIKDQVSNQNPPKNDKANDVGSPS